MSGIIVPEKEEEGVLREGGREGAGGETKAAGGVFRTFSLVLPSLPSTCPAFCAFRSESRTYLGDVQVGPATSGTVLYVAAGDRRQLVDKRLVWNDGVGGKWSEIVGTRVTLEAKRRKNYHLALPRFELGIFSV
ncbi:hypothetical protein ACLOJK_016942 [Asimina triloba]